MTWPRPTLRRMTSAARIWRYIIVVVLLTVIADAFQLGLYGFILGLAMAATFEVIYRAQNPAPATPPE